MNSIAKCVTALAIAAGGMGISFTAATIPPAQTPVAAPPAAERHLRNVRQLTFGGENAEAYFSADGRRLIFQSTRPGGRPCDEMFTMDTRGGHLRRVSTGTGRTTCGYIYPGRDRLLYASTHAA